MSNTRKLILVTGATGYIGGRLIPELLQQGYRVSVLVRDVDRIRGHAWFSQVDVQQGDVLKPETLDGVMEGVSAAYYLIHSMNTADDFHRRDVTAANNFVAAAEQAGIKQIVYLGGLGDPETDLSDHLRSRQATVGTSRTRSRLSGLRGRPNNYSVTKKAVFVPGPV